MKQIIKYPKLILMLWLSVISACGGGGGEPAPASGLLDLDGRWWLTGRYEGDCGDRGPWTGHLQITRIDNKLIVTSDDIGDQASRESWLLDASNTVSSHSEASIGDVTETRTASTRFISSSELTGVRTYQRADSNGSCSTTNYYTGIKLQTLKPEFFMGRHCLFTRSVSTDPDLQDNMEAMLEIEIRSANNDIRFITRGGIVQFNGLAEVRDDRLLLSGRSANGVTLEMELAFADSSAGINGTVHFDLNDPAFPPSTGSVEGQQRQTCWTGLPDGEPQNGSLPMDLDNATGIQLYGSEHDGIDFGFDYALDQTLLPVYASHDGVVTMVMTDTLWLGNIMHSVRINYNEDYFISINFEPFSADLAIAAVQKQNILVEMGEILRQGDLIGYLVVPEGAEFPSTHWGVGRSSTATTLCPAYSLTATERRVLENAVMSVHGPGVQSCQ